MASGEVFGLEAASFKRLLSCVFGIIIAFCIYGLLLESMTKGSHISEIGLILLLTNVYSIVAVIILRCTGEPLEHPSKWPAKLSFCLISFSYMAAMWCSTRALRFVNYPTQVLGKSCKAVPIVLISTCMGTRYTCGEYLAVILIVAGVAIFNMYRTGKGGGAFLVTGTVAGEGASAESYACAGGCVGDSIALGAASFSTSGGVGVLGAPCPILEIAKPHSVHFLAPGAFQ